MKKTLKPTIKKAVDPYKFDKDAYWDRRRKGLHGQVHPQGSPESRYDTRVALRRMHEDGMKKLAKGVGNERKNRKSPAKSLQS